MNTSIITINPDTKEITTHSTNDKEATEIYDKILLSPGGVPRIIPKVADQHENIFYLLGRVWVDKVKNRMASAKKDSTGSAWYIGIDVAITYASTS